MAAVQFVEPVGRDDEHALVVERARQIGEERAGRAVGPMDVLEHEQHGTALAQFAQQRKDSLEQATLAARVITGCGGVAAQRRHQGGQLSASAGG